MSPSAALLVLLGAAPLQVTFAGARKLAEDQAPEVALARIRTAVWRAEVAVAGALANPTVAVGSATQSAKLSTGVSVPLPLFGQRGSAVSAAEADFNVAQLDVEVARREARRAATLAWVDLWEAQRRGDLLAAAAKDGQRVFQVASEKFDVGIGAKVDVLRTRADWARAAAEAQAAIYEVTAAAARLALVLGVEVPPIASGEPAYAELPSELTMQLDDHPSLTRAREAVAAADAHLVAEQRLRWPVLNAQFAVNQFDPGFAGPEFVFGLSFDLPVLSLRGGAIERARAQRLLAETARSLEERRLRTEASDAWQRARANAAQRGALKTHVLPDLEEAWALTEEGYRLGRIELLRVLEAQKALFETRLAEVQALATWTRAVADLERGSNLVLVEGPAHAP